MTSGTSIFPSPAATQQRAARRTRVRVVSDTVFRVLFSVLFVVAGGMHLVAPDRVARRLAASPIAHFVTWVASPRVLVLAAGVVLLVAGLALLLGLGTRWAALALIGVLVPITITVQGGSGELGPLFKNIAILGGLIHFAVLGTGGAALERRIAFCRSGTS